MGREKHGRAPFGFAAKLVFQEPNVMRIEADCRLVHDQHFRLMEKSGREYGPLAHAVRVILREQIDEGAERKEVDHRLDPSGRHAQGHGVHVGNES